MQFLGIFLIGFVAGAFAATDENIKIVPLSGELKHEARKIDYPELEKKTVNFYLRNPILKKEHECFAKLKPGYSIDIVLDLAPSPSLDEVDARSAYCPVGHYIDLSKHVLPRRPTQVYIDAVQLFIDAVTLGLPKPEFSHVIIYEKSEMKKYFIRGRSVDFTEQREYSGEFNDLNRNLRTMWTIPTGSRPAESPLRHVVENNLGRMTRVALFNRDNGLPIVLNGAKRSKPVYTVVISDGASGASINELTTDFSRTTVIDIGERRFASRLTWEDMRHLVNVVTLPAPQALPSMISSVRNMLCWLINNKME